MQSHAAHNHTPHLPAPPIEVLRPVAASSCEVVVRLTKYWNSLNPLCSDITTYDADAWTPALIGRVERAELAALISSELNKPIAKHENRQALHVGLSFVVACAAAAFAGFVVESSVPAAVAIGAVGLGALVYSCIVSFGMSSARARVVSRCCAAINELSSVRNAALEFCPMAPFKNAGSEFSHVRILVYPAPAHACAGAPLHDHAGDTPPAAAEPEAPLLVGAGAESSEQF